MNPFLYAALFGTVGAVLFLWRKRLLTFNVASVYVVTFLVMNYLGVYVFLLVGEDVLLIPFPVTEGGLHRALLIANLGILGVFFGLWLVDRLQSRRGTPSYMELPRLDASLPLGVNPVLLWLVAVLAGLLFLALYFPLARPFVWHSLSGEVTDVMEFRLEMGSRELYVLRMLGYNVLPYVSLIFLVVSWCRRRWYVTSWLLVILSAVGLLYSFQKQPIVIYGLQIAAARLLFLRAREKTGEADKKSQFSRLLASWAVLAVIALAIATTMFFVARGFVRTGDLPEDVRVAGSLTLERFYMRTSSGYLLAGEFIPAVIPHFGLKNVYTIQRLMGEEYVPISNLLFIMLRRGQAEGNVSLDSLVTHYGQFGWAGLAILSVLQGVLLGVIDLYLIRQPPSIGAFILTLFLMRFALYLNEASIYGAALGFGGIVSVLLALLLNRRLRRSRRRVARRWHPARLARGVSR